MLKIHLGSSTPNDKELSDLYISERRGYYCDGATGKVTQGETWLGTIWNSVSGDGATRGPICADSASDRSDIPLFLNHGLWVDYLQERARSIGDCGYKLSVGELAGQETSEKLTTQFQFLNQDGSLNGNGSSTKVIYSGDRRLTEESEYRGSKLFLENSNKQPFYWRSYSWWSKLHPFEKINLGKKGE